MIFLLLGDQIQPNTKPMHTITRRMESWGDPSSCPYKSTEAAVRSFVSTLLSPCKHACAYCQCMSQSTSQIAPLDDHLKLLTVVRSRIGTCSTSGIVIYRQLAPTDCRQLKGGTYVNFLWNSSTPSHFISVAKTNDISTGVELDSVDHFQVRLFCEGL